MDHPTDHRVVRRVPSSLGSPRALDQDISRVLSARPGAHRAANIMKPVLWLSLNFFSGASAAFLLVSFDSGATLGAVAIILPLLVVSYLTYSTTMDRIADADGQVTELSRLHISTIETLAMAIDAKDQLTWGHVRRVQIGATRLAKAVGVRHETSVLAIEAAALLHDMGKLGVPEYILNKPGKLSPSEFDTMKLHVEVGTDVLSAIQFPYPVVPIVRHHHENWDGTGYPAGLAGTEIPIGARILAVADCFDALTSDRPYRPRLSASAALEELRARRGTMYDPVIVDVLVRVHTEILVAAEGLMRQTFPSTVTGPRIGCLDVAQPRVNEISASTEEMIVLYELGRRLGETKSFREAARVICNQMHELIPSSLYILYLKDRPSNTLRAAYVSSQAAADLIGFRIPIGQRISGWVAAHDHTISNGLASLDLGQSASEIEPKLVGCLCTSLTMDGDSIGVLAAYAESVDCFTKTHNRVIETAASIICPVLKRLILESATIDSSLERRLERTNNVVCQRLPVSILFIGIHDAEHQWQTPMSREQEHLAHVLEFLRPRLRASDTIFAYTSTELMVLLPATEPSMASGIAVRLLEDMRLPGLAYRIRYGVASAPADGESLQALIAVARHRVSVAFVDDRLDMFAFNTYDS